MVLCEVVAELRREFPISATHVRYAITAGFVERPPINGALTFDFSDSHLDQLRGYFRARAAGERPAKVNT